MNPKRNYNGVYLPRPTSDSLRELRAGNPLKALCASILLLWGGAAQATSQRDEAVYAAVEANRTESLELLKTIVNIDSGSGDIVGAQRIEAILGARLKLSGADVRYERAEAPDLPPNLVAVFRGTGKARVLIIAHIDTVFGPGTVARRPFSVDGDRAHGPGVGDEKAGVVTAVTALKILHDRGFKKYASLTLVLDSSEELGSPGSAGLIKTLAKQSDVAFNMEPSDPPYALTIWRKGAGNILIRVEGRSAHAGVAPQNGRNAAVELVHQLSALEERFPHVGDGVTVNLTVLKTGDRTNIIPDFAQATLDVRFRQPAEFDAIVSNMRAAIVPTIVPDSVVTVMPEAAPSPPLIENTQNDALGAVAQRIYAELGKPLPLMGSGGASESALASSVGTPTLDGLGCVGGDFHTDHEWLDVPSLSARQYLLTRLIMATGSRTQ